MARKKIAVITARADDNEQKMILAGIGEVAFSLDADVFVFSNIYNHWTEDALLNYEDHIYDYVQPEHFDGVIITAEAFRDLSVLEDLLCRIRRSGVPAVMIGGEAESFDTITSDDAADMARITSHLITVHGLTKFDILTGPEAMPVSHERVAGCRKAMEQHGIPFHSVRVHYGDFWTGSGFTLAQQYLSGEAPMPQAVICTNDHMAYGLCEALTEAGVSIPEQIMITGYDHTEDRLYHHPLLTTCRRSRQKQGMEAAAQLLAPDLRLPEYAQELLLGNTCGCGVDFTQLGEEIRSARIGQYHTVMNSVAQFSGALTLCRTLAEYTAVLREYLYLLHGAETLYLCLDRQWNGPRYGGEAFLCCTICKDEPSDMPQYVPWEQLPACLQKEQEAPRIFCCSPLCFQTRMFGYTVAAFTEPRCYDFSYRDWNKSVVNALEILRMKNDIHYLTGCQRISTLYDSLTGFYYLHEFEALINEIPEERYLQAVKLVFFENGEYLYGENYRSDIIAASARAIRAAGAKHMVCCRTDEALFFILCRKEEGAAFSQRLQVMLHHTFCGIYDENQVAVIYDSHAGTIDHGILRWLRRQITARGEETAKAMLQRKQYPHFPALLSLRSEMQNHPDNALSTEEICKKLCISEGYFRMIYKKYFDVSYVQDCIHARVMLACYLLLTTAMSVYAVSRKCGYTDEKFFSRQFRTAVGCSPVRYRERYHAR